MTPYYEAPDLRLFCGDALTVLRTLPSESVQCCVTSPPYFGLRSYATAPQIWGGDPEHTHGFGDALRLDARGSGQGDGTTGRQRGETYGRNALRGACCACGAWLGELGLEPTPAMYVTHLVDVFRELRRVLRRDGTLWVVIGDSFAAHGRMVTDAPPSKTVLNGYKNGPSLGRIAGYQPKEILGIPWRLAFALQADGWRLRSDIVWQKPNATPEPVRDRPSRAHEYVFLLTRSRRYYYGGDAVKEPAVSEHPSGNGYARPEQLSREGRGSAIGWTPDRAAGFRNRRSVWTVPTAPFPGAHFAVMPTALVEPCILAGSRPGDTVLDPFAGSGTVLQVAREWGRGSIGIELNPAYCALAVARVEQQQPALREVPA